MNSKKLKITEAVGVSTIISTASQLVFEEILDFIRENLITKWLGKPFSIKSNSELKEVIGNECTFTIKLGKSQEEFELIKASVYLNNKFFVHNNKLKLGRKNLNEDVVSNVELIFGINEDVIDTKLDLINILEKNKAEIISTIAHEFKHVLDNTKFSNTLEGQIHTILGASPDHNLPLAYKKLLYGLYYVSKIEQHVLNTEVYTNAKVKQITKKDFKDFLKKSYAYNTLKSLKELDLNLQMPVIDTNDVSSFTKIVFQSIQDTFYTRINSELVKHILHLINLGKKEFSEPDVEHIFKKLESKYRKEPNKVVEGLAKYVRHQADKLLRKLVKIYSLLPD